MFLTSSKMTSYLYEWVIIEESLIDNRILNNLNIVELEITTEENPEDRWHIYTVLMSKDEILNLAKYLKPSKFYAHFWSGNDMIAVFSGKTFEFYLDDRNSWKDAIEYGLSIDIPEEQLDFSID